MNYLSLLISISTVLLIAIACEYGSPYLSSIVASAPTGTPIALYYAASSSNNPTVALIQSTDGLVKGASCTLIFAVVAKYAAHNGLTLYPLLFISYLAYGISYYVSSLIFNNNGNQHSNLSEIRPAK